MFVHATFLRLVGDYFILSILTLQLIHEERCMLNGMQKVKIYTIIEDSANVVFFWTSSVLVTKLCLATILDVTQFIDI